jgi:hypothetical protein
LGRVPIIQLGPVLIATVQEELRDRDAAQLQVDLMEALERTSAHGVLVDLSIAQTIDSFLAGCSMTSRQPPACSARRLWWWGFGPRSRSHSSSWGWT